MKWISIKDQIPKEDKQYNLLLGNEVIYNLKYDNNYLDHGRCFYHVKDNILKIYQVTDYSLWQIHEPICCCCGK